jgi:hypothetical protein
MKNSQTLEQVSEATLRDALANRNPSEPNPAGVGSNHAEGDGEQQRTKSCERVKQEGPTDDREPRIRITATVLNIDRNESSYEVSYVDLDGTDRTKRFGRELFLNPSKVVELLVKAHADLPDDRGAAVAV